MFLPFGCQHKVRILIQWFPEMVLMFTSGFYLKLNLLLNNLGFTVNKNSFNILLPIVTEVVKTIL